MWQWFFCVAVVAQSYVGLHQWWPVALLFLLRYLPWLLQRRTVLTAVLAVAFGVFWAHYHLQWAYNAWLPTSLEGHPITVRGEVQPFTWRELSSRFGGRRFAVTLKLLPSSATAPSDGVVHLSYYADEDEVVQPLSGGDVVTAQVRLKRPYGTVNEGVLDSAQLDLARGVIGRGTLLTVEQRVPARKGLPLLREQVSNKLRRLLEPWPRAATLAPALVVADRRWLDEEQWRQYRDSGTAHLMSISGLHVSLVAGLVWMIGRWCCVLLVPASQTASRLALWPALFAALLYAGLAGFSLPTQRAVIMAAVMMLSVWRGQQGGLTSGFRVACVLVLLWQPLSVLDPSFWMSFLAIGALLLLFRVGVRGIWWRAQWLLSFALGAIGAWWFGSWGVLSPLANLVLIPVFAWCVVPLALLLALGAPVWLFAPLLEGGIALAEQWLAWLTPWQGQLVAPHDGFALLLLALVVFLFCLPRLPFSRWLLLFLCLPWWWPRGEVPPYGSFDFIVFDVGQGQATAIRTRHHLLLYDAGPEWGSGDAGQTVVVPWLQRQVQKLSLGIISHADNDHSGGWGSVRQYRPEVRWLNGEAWRMPRTEQCWRGQQWQWDGVTFAVLWPPAGLRLQQSNNNSCVVYVHSEHGHVLLTGDLHKPAEFWLSNHHTFLPNTVLQVPHHGSATSSSYAFLQSVAPRYAVVGHGYKNAYNHPAPAVTKRYETLEIPLLSTVQSGMIVIPMRGEKNTKPIEWRTRFPKPWREVAKNEQ